MSGYVCTKGYDDRLGLAMTLLAYEMQSRGRQSWGWTNGDQIVKSTGPIMDEWNNTLLGYEMCGIHTRHATTGGITEANSHPWKVGSLLGMHNGMVYNHFELNRKYHRDFPVDSMHILAHIDEGKPLSEIESYGAVVFWKDGKVHLGRWNSGELSLARVPFGWVWASTKSALEHCLSCAGIEEDVHLLTLKEGRLYILDGDNIRKSSVKLDFQRGTSGGKWQDYCGPMGNSTPGNSSTGGNRLWKWNDEKHGFDLLSDGSPKTDTKYTEKDILTAEEAQSATEVVKTDSADAVKASNKVVNERIGEMLDKAAQPKSESGIVYNGKELPTHGVISEKDARAKKRPLEPKWKCIWCNSVLKDGENYGIDLESCLVCADCCVRYPDSIAAGPFVKLPAEIVTVDSMFSEDERDLPHEWDCEACATTMRDSDPMIETPDGQFVCIECWREMAMRHDIREEQDAAELGGHLGVDDLTKQFTDSVAHDDSHDQTLIGMDEASPMNEAEALKRTGVALPTKEELFDMPTKNAHLQ